MSSAALVSIPWYRSTFVVALVGSLLMWAAFPPLGWGFLGWLAPIPWLVLVQASTLPGRRPYRALWLAGLAFWLLVLQWLRLPHPATSLGWLALSAYLACYLPAFVGLSRVAVHRVGMPLWLAAPIVWTGLELFRAHFLTGFLLASLSHTQVHWPLVIQISDLFGQYGVDFLMMLVAACGCEGLRIADCRLRIEADNPQSAIGNLQWKPRPFAFLPAVLVLGAVLVYGHMRLSNIADATDEGGAAPQTLRIALIQGNSLAEWKYDPSREQQIMDEYIGLSRQAVEQSRERDGRPVDLVVWPETMFRTPLVTFDAGYQLPAEVANTPERIASYGPTQLATLARRLDTPVLVGVERAHCSNPTKLGDENPPAQRYNSAVLVDRDGKILGTYDKVHPVMFGEFIPLAKWLPFLYRVTPLTGGIEAGVEPVVMAVNDVLIAPNICYETVVPHVIRRQANTLLGDSVPPDVLINLTNDAWYWGSSELDLHLACGVFRAVETRKPLVIAANGGLSAWIDCYGRIREVSPRQAPHFLLADVEPCSMPSWYRELGDWFAFICLIFCVGLAIIGWSPRFHSTQTRRGGDQETRRES